MNGKLSTLVFCKTDILVNVQQHMKVAAFDMCTDQVLTKSPQYFSQGLLSAYVTLKVEKDFRSVQSDKLVLTLNLELELYRHVMFSWL